MLTRHPDMACAPCSAGIYAIVCYPSGKVYIGSTQDIRKRWRKHVEDLCAGRHHCRHLQSAWNLYGPDAFTFRVLEPIAHITRKADLIAPEQRWLDRYPIERRYNIRIKADSSLGVKRSAETREKVRQANLGKVKWSAEERLRMSITRKGRKTWNKGIPCPEHVKQLSRARKGEKRPKTSATLMGHRGWNKGRTYGPGVRAKVSAAGKGRPKTEAHKRKIARANAFFHALKRARLFDRPSLVAQAQLFVDTP